MRSHELRWALLGLLMPLGTTQGQVPPDTLLEGIGNDVYVWNANPAGFALREMWQVANQQTVSTIVIDPRNGDLWGVTAQGLTQLHRTGNILHFGRSISLFFGYANAQGAGFDDQGILHLSFNGHLAKIDLERGLVLSEVHSLPGFSMVFYAPPRAGRPAIANGWGASRRDWRLVALDGNLSITHTYFSHTVPYGYYGQGMILTTDAGETYVANPYGGLDPSSDPRYAFARIDYQRGRLIGLSNAAADPNVSGMMYDPSRNVLYLAGGFGLASPPVDRFAVYDLATHRISHTDPFLASFSPDRPGWFPQNQLHHWPRTPVPTQPFTAHLALGGYPGELGMIYFSRARIASQVITSIATPVWIAPLDGSGVLPLPIPYDPVLFPMNSGDGLTFQGFLWNGFQLRATPEIEMAWE